MQEHVMILSALLNTTVAPQYEYIWVISNVDVDLVSNNLHANEY
jgi:hypothetical protein